MFKTWMVVLAAVAVVSSVWATNRLTQQPVKTESATTSQPKIPANEEYFIINTVYSGKTDLGPEDWAHGHDLWIRWHKDKPFPTLEELQEGHRKLAESQRRYQEHLAHVNQKEVNEKLAKITALEFLSAWQAGQHRVSLRLCTPEAQSVYAASPNLFVVHDPGSFDASSRTLEDVYMTRVSGETATHRYRCVVRETGYRLNESNLILQKIRDDWKVVRSDKL